MSEETSLIVRIAARGDGVTASGRHVAGAVPGDRLDEGGGLVWGPDHRDPVCRHFTICGGCQLQQCSDTALAQFVADRVTGPLAGKGIVAEDLRPVHLSPPYSRRRAALRFSKQGKSVRIGFSTTASHRIVHLLQCDVMHPALFATMTSVQSLIEQWPIGRVNGDLELTLCDQGIDLLIRGLMVDGLDAHERLVGFAEKQGLARLAVDQGDGPETQWEPEPVTISFNGVAVTYPHGPFLQATRDGEAALVAAASEALTGSAIIADLFAGLGTFALNLAAPGRKILAAEAARDPVMALKLAANRQQLAVFADHRDLFRRPLRSEELDRFDAVVLDPPRAGAEMQVAELAASKVARICYVSCNPATFARDAQVLVAGGYRLKTLWPVGQFRWSTHVELASLFVREA